MRFASIAFALLLAACSSHQGRPDVSSPATPEKRAYTVQRDVGYSPVGWPEALKANLYRPEGPGLKPGVLLIHGGGWAAPDRREQMASIAERLAARGYVVMNANYRYAPQYRYPAQVDDLREALKWLRAHAGDYGVDAKRVAAVGYSAGGHLAAQLGALDGPPEVRVRAVVAGGAPSDLRKYEGGTLVPDFLGGSQTQVPQQFLAASPITHVSADDPPVFLYHGGLDTLVPLDHAEDYKAALDAAKVPSELFVLRGREHVTAFLTDGPAIAAAIDFLDRQLR